MDLGVRDAVVIRGHRRLVSDDLDLGVHAGAGAVGGLDGVDAGRQGEVLQQDIAVAALRRGQGCTCRIGDLDLIGADAAIQADQQVAMARGQHLLIGRQAGQGESERRSGSAKTDVPGLALHVGHHPLADVLVGVAGEAWPRAPRADGVDLGALDLHLTGSVDRQRRDRAVLHPDGVALAQHFQHPRTGHRRAFTLDHHVLWPSFDAGDHTRTRASPGSGRRGRESGPRHRRKNQPSPVHL